MAGSAKGDRYYYAYYDRVEHRDIPGVKTGKAPNVLRGQKIILKNIHPIAWAINSPNSDVSIDIRFWQAIPADVALEAGERWLIMEGDNEQQK
jgi:hypothetical protein